MTTDSNRFLELSKRALVLGMKELLLLFNIRSFENSLNEETMKLLILILLIQIGNCKLDNSTTGFEFYESKEFLAFIILQRNMADNKRNSECSKPNSIVFSQNGSSCIDSRVTKGLILDSSNNLEIDSDTLSPGKSFYCQCGKDFKYSQWYRTDSTLENGFSNVQLSFIFASSVASYSKNIPLVFNLDYKATDNLVCLSKCPVSGENFQFQTLKIR